MNKKLWSMMVFGALALNAMAQGEDDNWVTNYSFEDILPNKKLKKDKSINFATGWDSPTGLKADLYTKKSASDPLIGTDKNTYGKEKPENGDNYAGIVAYSFGDKQPRTYLTTKLAGPMKKDQEYCVRFKVSLGDNSKYAVNNIGAHLSKGSLNTEDKKSLLVETHVHHSQNKIYNNTFGWETVCSIYKANGGEEYLTIGNFSLTKDTKNEKVIKPKDVSTQLGIAYYYIDQVEVFLLDSVEQCQCERRTTEKAHVVITEDYSSNKDFTAAEKVDQCKILFDHLQTEVTNLYIDKVNQLVTVLNENPELKVTMHAHSEKSEVKAGENNDANKDIAKKRSEAVLKVLTDAGIDKSRIRIKILDDTEMIDQGTSETSKARNRRVEFHVQK